MELYNVFFLLFIFQFKHFLADYPLQTPYMLKKFKPDWDFFFPLVSHSLVHATITLMICLLFNPKVALFCFLIDFFFHFSMDRIKAGPKYLGRFKDMYDKKFWWSLGLDQMWHHLTHYLIIYLILCHK